MEPARRAKVELIYEGVNISDDIAPYLEGCTYTDNMHGKADEITVTLNNRSGVWTGDWLPQKSDRIRASIIVSNWRQVGDAQRLFCGEFSVDELDFSGPPSILKIKAVSTPVDGSLRREKKTRAWESVALSEIAEDIASAAGLQMFYDVDTDILYDRQDQHEESDLAFVQRLCEDAGLAAKVTDSRMVIFDEMKYEKKDTVAVFSRFIDYSFTTQAHDMYKACRVEYFDPAEKQERTYEHQAENVSSGQVLVDHGRVNSVAEARQRAKRLLHAKNKHETEGAVSLMGNPSIVAGVNIKIEDHGAFDGKYLVTKAMHKVSGSYSLRLDIRRGKDD